MKWIKKLLIVLSIICSVYFIGKAISTIDIMAYQSFGNVTEYGFVDATKPFDAYSPYVDKVNGNVIGIEFAIKIYADEDGTYTVKIKTEDYTSIASAGDYTPITDGEIKVRVMDGVGISKRITIRTKKESGVVQIEDISSYFYVIMTSINGYSVNKKLKCYRDYNYNLEYLQVALPYQYILKAYTEEKTTTLISGDKLSVDSGTTTTKEIALNSIHYGSNATVDMGISDYYVSVEGKISGSSWTNYDWYKDFFNIYLSSNGYKIRDNYYPCSSLFSWDKVIMSEREANDDFYDDWEWSEQYSSSSYYGKTSSNVKYFVEGDNTYYQVSTSSAFLNFTNPSVNSELELKEFYAKSFIVDTKAPKVVGSYVLNDITKLSKNDKLRIAVRFSEPVQYIGQKPTLLAKTDSAKTPNLTLDYKAGAGTCTLVFELNIDDDMVYSFSKIKEISVLADHIRDFSYGNHSGQNNYASSDDLNIKCDFDIKIDTRMPSIDITNRDALKNIISKTKDITISVGGVDEDGLSIKYKFIPKSIYDNSSNYDFESDLIEYTDSNLYTFTEGDKNGDYYLYIKVTSYYGRVVDNKDTLSSLVLKFDNIPPKIDELKVTPFVDSDDVTHYDKHQFSFKLTDNPYNDLNTISKIKVVYSKTSIPTSNDLHELIVYDANISNSRTTVSGNSYSFILDGVNDFGLKNDDYLDYYIGIVAIDTALNEIDIFSDDFKQVAIRFDLRSKLNGEFSIDGSLVDEAISKIDGNVNLYAINTKIQFIVSSLEAISESTKFNYILNKYTIDSSGNNKVICLSELDYDDALAYYDYNFDKANNSYNVILKQSGYYEITFNIDKVKYSETFKIYISNYNDANKSEITGNFNNSENIINKVYSTNENLLYYCDGTNVLTYKYNNSTKPQMFSSLELLKEYIKLQEYQDLYALVLTDETAQALNSGISTVMRKAQGETTVPKRNQIWIRYKKSNFSFSTSYTEWVYYYYANYTGSDISINVNNLSVNLKNAINSVVDKISQKCSVEYLITEDYLVNGVPYLSKEQIHVSQELVNKTILNISLENAIFSGDSNIYNSYYEIDGSKYYIASNDKIKFNAYTKIFYARTDSPNEYVEIKANSDGKSLKEILDTGRYIVYEIDDKGYSAKLIYITREAPGLTISYIAKNDTVIEKSISKESDGQIFNAKSMQLKELLYDIDDYAYVAIYNYNNTSKYSIYYKSDLANSAVDLTSGKYLVEVGDRFGNSYQFVIQLNNDDLDFNVSIYDNEYIKVTTKLTIEDIYSFEVYLNGEQISSEFKSEMYFKESGLYRFLVEDIYGNVLENEYELRRDIPNVNWFYNLNGDFININDVESGIIIKKISDNFYKITTNSLLQFSFASNEDYGYTFQEQVDYDEGVFYGVKRININEAKSFKVRIYYNQFNNCYIDYNIIYDNTPPIISAYVDSNNYIYDDRDKLEGPNASFDNINDVGFKKGESTSFYISNGDEIYNNKIHLSISDEIDISYIRILLDSKIVYEAFENITSYELQDYGKYEITCKDLLGNSSTFSFTNCEPKYFKYFIDDELQIIDFNPLEVFENDIRLFGHNNIIYQFNEINELALLVDGKYFLFTVADNILNQRYIENESLASKILLDGNKTSTNDYQELFKFNNLLVEINYENNYFKLKITTSDDQIHNISARVISDNSSIPFYSNIELCNKKSEMKFEVADAYIKIVDYQGFSNDIFRISSIDEDIKSISYSYSQSQSFKNYIELDLNDLPMFGENDGFYSFVVTNKYKNITKYLIVISRELLVEVNTIFNDEYTISYKIDYKSEYYSNNSITIRVYNLNALTKIELSGKEYLFDKDINEQYYEIVLNNEGVYDITIEDESGNIKACQAIIEDKELKLNDDIIVGFNDKALKRAELYTNQSVSINKDLISSYGIYIIYVKYEEKETLLYDNLSMNTLINFELLNNVVGYYGSGQYKIIFRNIYGSIKEFVVNYQESSTLSISRMTLSDVKYQSYDFTNNNVYSNSRVMVTSTATQYIFKIDGKTSECPYEFCFPTNTVSGYYEYNVYYLDEYGFEYNIMIYLIRQNIEYELSTDPKIIDSLTITNKDFYVDFNDEYQASYTYDGNSYSYLPKAYLKSDGSYIFTIWDLSGNKTTFTIKKDSIVSFIVKEVTNDRILVNGDVTNNNQVMLVSQNGDDIKIDYAYLNGVLVDDPSQSFTDSGKWELILSDAVGNHAYFSFYILTHAISSFIYKTPYNYKITEIIYKDLMGNKISFMDNVIQSSYYSTIDLALVGTYSILMKSISDGNSSAFEIMINNIDVTLVGVENEGTTNQNVTLKGYNDGDTILIYKDNKLIRTINVSSSEMKSPIISDAGDYRIEIVNIEGNKTILKFRRSYTANTASSIFIVVVLGGIAVILFIGLFSRKREKIE